MEKRHDIQGLRAWAVISVVIFHFFPSILPGGYLGVDVFFVLSGFLISLVLEHKPVSISTYSNFYFKRIRRIFPLLLLIVFFCSLFSFICLTSALFIYSEKSALLAALFMTNLKGQNEGEDYFRDLEKASDLFTHTWSLSVEIQFYLIAPFLLHIFKPSSPPLLSLVYLLSLATISSVYAILFPSYAFYSTPARLWQFIVGSIAFHLQKPPPLTLSESEISRPTSTIDEKILPLILAVTSIALCLWEGKLESALRNAVTLTAAGSLVLKFTTPLLTHRILQTIGDSSYALYLIHWPVVSIARYYGCDQWLARLISMLLCFVAAIFVYHIYEKWYLTLNEKHTFILIAALYLVCAAIYSQAKVEVVQIPLNRSTVKPLSIDEVTRMNKQMDLDWERNLIVDHCTLRGPRDRNPWGFCYLPRGNGTLKFLIVGNSYAANHGKMIIENLKAHYGEIAVHTVGECEPLVETDNKYCTSETATKSRQEFLEDIESFKPDVLFQSARFIEPNVPIVTPSVQDDGVYKGMMEKLKRYEKNVKKVFILQAFPRPANLEKIEDARKKAGIKIESFMEEAIEADSIPMRRRVEELAKNCEKCVIYDIKDLHMVDGKFTVVDPTTHLHYFEALRHHTPIGLKLVKPLYEKLSLEFERLMASKTPENVLKIGN